jgi:hypothetical protein
MKDCEYLKSLRNEALGHLIWIKKPGHLNNRLKLNRIRKEVGRRE